MTIFDARHSSGIELLLFTDLDGTLLDHYTYSAGAAQPALNALAERAVPWIPNTSKTFAELEPLRLALAHTGPFVVENGAAIYLPRTSRWSSAEPLASDRKPLASDRKLLASDGDYRTKCFGRERDDLLEQLEPYRKQYRFRGFSEMEADELVSLTGLQPEEAQLALERKYSEPLFWQDSEEALDKMRASVRAAGLKLVRGGRFVHLMGQHDKADALKWMRDLISRQGRQPLVVALGDGENDLDMLNAADIPVVIRSPVHPPITPENTENLILTEETGPEGWNRAVLDLLSQLDAVIQRD